MHELRCEVKAGSNDKIEIGEFDPSVCENCNREFDPESVEDEAQKGLGVDRVKK